MSSTTELDGPPIVAEALPSDRGGMLPWSWPEGARVLLAVVAISAAIGLMVARRDAPRPARIEAAASDLKLDPNRATAGALAALPHIGPTLARRIVEAQADGPFRSPDDLKARVRGIGPVTLARIAPYLRFDGAGTSPARLDSPGVMIVDAGKAAAGTSRKPPRSRSRKAKGPSVALAAKAGAAVSP